METQLPPKGAQLPPPIFGPYLLWPNGWIDWYGVKPRPRRFYVRWGPSSPKKKRHSPTQFLAHVYCGQTAGWMKTPLGTEVDLGSGHIVLDGDPPRKGHSSPLISAYVYCGHGRPSQLLLSSCYKAVNKFVRYTSVK